MLVELFQAPRIEFLGDRMLESVSTAFDFLYIRPTRPSMYDQVDLKIDGNPAILYEQPLDDDKL
jgi:hypothetical protein